MTSAWGLQSPREQKLTNVQRALAELETDLNQTDLMVPSGGGLLDFDDVTHVSMVVVHSLWKARWSFVFCKKNKSRWKDIKLFVLLANFWTEDE